MLASASGELYIGLDERITGTNKVKAVVAHIRPSGALDKTFGTKGIAGYSALGANGSHQCDRIGRRRTSDPRTDLQRPRRRTRTCCCAYPRATGAVSTELRSQGRGGVAGVRHRDGSAVGARLVVMGWPTSGRTNANTSRVRRQAGTSATRSDTSAGDGQDDLADVVAGLDDPVRLGRVRQAEDAIHHRTYALRGDLRPDVLDDGPADGGLLR